MKVWRQLGIVGLSGGVLLLAVWAGAQTNLATPPALVDSTPAVTPGSESDNLAPAANTRDGQIVVPVKPTVSDTTIYGIEVDRPFLASTRNQISPELKERLLRFERYRKAFLEKQEALRKELQTATDEDRARVRERLQTLRKEWLERMRDLRLDFKERLPDLAGKLKEHSEVIRSARDDARDAARDAAREQAKNLKEQISHEGVDRD